MFSNGFFPDSTFGWAFYAILVALTLLAAFFDFKSVRIPKWVTFTLLGFGVLLNMVRGAWLGSDGSPVWVMGNNGPVLGLLDGFLFSLAGFLTGFGLFFLMFILGICGGGDVKLFAALGAWLGPKYVFFVLIGTMFVLVPLGILALLLGIGTQGFGKTWRDYSWKSGKKVDGKLLPRQRLMTYSFPCAVATAVVMLFIFRVDLKLVDRNQLPRINQEGQMGTPIRFGG